MAENGTGAERVHGTSEALATAPSFYVPAFMSLNSEVTDLRPPPPLSNTLCPPKVSSVRRPLRRCFNSKKQCY